MDVFAPFVLAFTLLDAAAMDKVDNKHFERLMGAIWSR